MWSHKFKFTQQSDVRDSSTLHITHQKRHIIALANRGKKRLGRVNPKCELASEREWVCVCSFCIVCDSLHKVTAARIILGHGNQNTCCAAHALADSVRRGQRERASERCACCVPPPRAGDDIALASLSLGCVSGLKGHVCIHLQAKFAESAQKWEFQSLKWKFGFYRVIGFLLSFELSQKTGSLFL
jgi:hypothetical protein